MPLLAQAAADIIANKYAGIVQARLAFEPPPTNRAYGQFEWTSIAQKHYVLWLLHGAKYVRTHDLANWTVEAMRGTAESPVQIAIERSNPLNPRGEPYRKYVTGNYQQRFHAITGWPRSGPILQDIGRQMTNEFSAVIQQMVTEEE